MKLNINNVNKTIMACLYNHEDVAESAALGVASEPCLVQSVILRVDFSAAKVQRQKHNIKSMLDELPLVFHPEAAGGGGGMSFLQMCVTRDGEQWGEHRSCDELVALGLAAGFCTFPMERSMWPVLPGGMPYICVDTSDTPVPVAVSAPL